MRNEYEHWIKEMVIVNKQLYPKWNENELDMDEGNSTLLQAWNIYKRDMRDFEYEKRERRGGGKVLRKTFKREKGFSNPKSHTYGKALGRPHGKMHEFCWTIQLHLINYNKGHDLV